jgi:hypothetical protein
MKHGLALGVVQLLIGIATQADYRELVPLRYHVPFPGARLRGEQLHVQPS